MITLRVSFGIALTLLAMSGALTAQSKKAECITCAGENRPKFKLRVERSSQTELGLLINVSFRGKQIAIDNLICALAKSFRRSAKGGVVVQVFDNREAAKHYVFEQEQEKPAE